MRTTLLVLFVSAAAFGDQIKVGAGKPVSVSETKAYGCGVKYE